MKKGIEERRKEEKEGVETLASRFRVLNINIEPYIIDYMLKNYFKLHDLMPFQMRGMLTHHPPHHFSLYSHYPFASSSPTVRLDDKSQLEHYLS